MLYFLIPLLVLLSGLTFVGGLLYDKHIKRLPEITPQATRPTPELPTRTDRWMQEQEHEWFPQLKLSHTHCRVCGPGPLKNLEVPSAYDHVYLADVFYTDDYGHSSKVQGTVATPEAAEVVSSQIEGTSWHTPMIDIDLPARLLESSTPGHHHLYIDKPMHWRQYKRMLRAMHKAGIIEKGFYKVSVGRGATHLRPPWVEKKLEN